MAKLSNQHQLILIVAIAASALIGAITGVVAATTTSGLIHGSSWFFPAVTGTLSDTQVNQKIVELIEEESATIAVVQRMTPAVVSVVIKVPRSEIGEEGDAMFDVFGNPTMSDTDITADGSDLVEVGGGTGFFVSADGYIVTNRHVVNEDGATYTVVTNDGVELPATVVAQDPFLDLALLDVEGDDYPTVTLGDSDKIQIGQTVIAVGNTLSEFQNTVTKGVISGINRRVIAGDTSGEEVLEGAIQTDAAINPGNSGGPLINLLGEVVGVNTAVSFEGQSLGFAIPINDIKKAVRDVKQYGRIIRPWLGVRYVMLTPESAAQERLPVDHGAYVVAGDKPDESAIIADSPAEEAGIQEGDVILSVNDVDLTNDQSLGPVISNYYPGDVVSLKVARGEEIITVPVTLSEAKK